MPVGAMIFLGVVLALFAILDIYMLVSLSKPGDERNQIIVWKASSFTLLGVFGANILTVIEKIVTAQPLTQNPLVQLEVFAIIYFIDNIGLIKLSSIDTGTDSSYQLNRCDRYSLTKSHCCLFHFIELIISKHDTT